MATDEATRAVPPSGSDAPTTSETTTDTTTAPDGERTDALTPEARSAPDRATQDESADDDTTADSSGRSGGRPAGKRRPPAARVSTIKPAPPSTTTASRRPARTRSRAPFWTWRKAAVLALLAAVFAVVAVVSAFQPGTSAPANVAFVNLPLTSQIKAQASTRICQVFNIDYTNLDGWQKAGASATTGKASQNFQKYVDGVKQALQQSNVTSGSSDCKVDVVGVKSADDQNAVLLTNLIFSDNRNGVIQGSNTVRYQVDMHNVNGNWLVADFNGF
ncbi:hypothetical protein [Williamsia sterculiae]|nr:hypothetical protein [Williamsia sterculiae]